MINDNAKTAISSSPKPENAAQDSRKPNQNHDAAARSRSSQQILTTLTGWRRADNVARRPKRAAAATLPVLQRDGAMYAPALPRDLAVTFDATHVTRPDQVSLRQHEAKQSLSANPAFRREPPDHRVPAPNQRLVVDPD